MAINVKYISPEEILMMDVTDYLRQYANKDLKQSVYFRWRLNDSTGELRNAVEGHPIKTECGKPLKVWDFVRIPMGNLKRAHFQNRRINWMNDALNKNHLNLAMSDEDIQDYLRMSDGTEAVLKRALGLLCNKCLKENKRDFSRVYEQNDAIAPGFECYIMITRV